MGQHRSFTGYRGIGANAILVIGEQYGLTPDEVRRALGWARIAKNAAHARARAPELVKRSIEQEIAEAPRAQWDFCRVEEPKDGKAYCAQCDRRVHPAEAAVCRNQFCKVAA